MEDTRQLFSNPPYPHGKTVLNTCIKYRYLLALILFVILTALRINGSSVGMWSNVLTGTRSSVLAGNARPIRSDEWLTQTPYYIAQAQSNTPYSLINPNISISGQNMIVSYGAPVLDISLLAKPLSWGFFLFGPSIGLSWYWNMKVLLLFLLSFELCRIITRGNDLVSLLGGVWIALSPAVQWWFMQHVCDILLYMEAVVVLFVCYLRNTRKPWPLRLLIAFGFWMASCGFALTIYPAIQVPLLYLGLMMMAIFFWNMRKTIRLNWQDALIVSGTTVFAVVMMLHVYLVSKGAIHAILNTSYPGQRISTGGGWGNLPQLNIFLVNPFLPFKDIASAYLNNCESSSFFQFFPLSLTMLPILIKRKNKNLTIGIGFGIFSLLCIFYLFFKIPVWLAKITLLSYVTSRIAIAYGISAMFMSIWALGELGNLAKSKRIRPLFAGLICIGIGGFYFLTVYFTPLKGYIHLRYIVTVVIGFSILSYFMMRGKKKTFSALMSVIIIVSGTTVNPVNIGIGPLTNSALAVDVRNIVKKDPHARWISLNNASMGNFLYANGAKTLNGTNYYPDMAKWAILDPGRQHLLTYNRYAHIIFHLTKGPTEFVNPQADVLEVSCTTIDLKRLGIKYVMISSALSTEKIDPTDFTKVTPTPINGYYIYTLK